MISFLYRQSSRIFTFLRLILTPLILHFYLFYFPLLIPHVPIKCRKCRLLIWAQKQIANIERSHQRCQKQHGHTAEPSLCIQKNRWYYILNAADQPPADKAKGQAE